jgi:hypothetical protein
LNNKTPAIIPTIAEIVNLKYKLIISKSKPTGLVSGALITASEGASLTIKEPIAIPSIPPRITNPKKYPI